MTGQTAACGDDTDRGMHAVNVVRAGFLANQNDVRTIAGPADGIVRIEHDNTAGCPGRCRQAAGNRLRAHRGIDGWIKQAVEIVRIDPHHRIPA